MAGAPPLHDDPVAAPYPVDWREASKVGRTCFRTHAKRLLASKRSGVSDSWARSSELIAGCLIIDISQSCGASILRILRAEELITTQHLSKCYRVSIEAIIVVLVGFEKEMASTVVGESSIGGIRDLPILIIGSGMFRS
jgi:hypothetical protein